LKKAIDLKDAYLEVDRKSEQKFRIATAHNKMKLRADNMADAKRWITAIEKITGLNSKEIIMARARRGGSQKRKINGRPVLPKKRSM